MIKFLLDASSEAPAPVGAAQSQWGPILLMGGLLIVMYIFMILPQKKQEKKRNEMLNNLKVGDEITTTGGIIGKIISMKDETITIETSRDKTKIRLLKSAVRNVDVPAEEAEE